jgi:hypothetical protein
MCLDEAAGITEKLTYMLRFKFDQVCVVCLGAGVKSQAVCLSQVKRDKPGLHKFPVEVAAKLAVG